MIRGINKAYAISAVGHGVVLLWSVLSFAAKPLPTPPSEALPVDIVSVSEFTQMTAGNKDAPKVEAQKPLVEKVAEAKPVEDPTAKVVEKKEVKAAREAPPPVPETKPAEPEKKVAEVKPDQVAEALAKDEAKPSRPSRKKRKPSRQPRPRSLPHRRPSSIPRRSKRCSTSAIRRGLRPPATPSTARPRWAPRAARRRKSR